MSDTYHSSSKPWRIFSIIISAIMILSFISPLTINTAYAADIPQPIYPENGIVTTPIATPIPNSSPYPPLAIPSFTWSAVAGATMYCLQVDSEPEFKDTIIVNITTQNTSYTPKFMSTPLFADGDWYWRVRVEQPLGEWSEVWQFEKKWATEDNKPELLSPVDDPAYPLSFFDYPVFSWNPVIGAAKYRFEIAEDEEFTIISLSKDTLATSYQPVNRLANNTYFWHVIPMDKADHLGTSSDVRSFRLEYGKSADQIPELIEPADGSFPKFTPTFQWKPVRGAELYRLEYTSDQYCDFNVGAKRTLVITRQTSYTPMETFPNDFGYCWRVRVESDPAVGDWSETRTFEKKWDLAPVLLTPRHLYQGGLYPLYSWTPVPGAASYRIDIAENKDFTPILESSNTANTTYTPQTKYDGTAHYWWRVTAFDGSGNKGSTSYDEFQSYSTSIAPILVYPLYYYPPNHYGEQYSMNSFEDRTIPYPIFIWHRVMTPTPEGGVYATAYRIQVATSEYFDVDTVWEYDTENTSTTPIDDDDFTPLNEDQDYYWRVCVLDPDPPDPFYVNCLDPVSGWSQIWRTRFNPELALTPTTGSTPELLRPAHGQESVEATPLLEWWPLQGATQYQVVISRDANFYTPIISETITETVNIPAYAPSYSLAQRSLNRTDYGTFYWRVRGLVGGAWSGWSNTCVGCVPWRFQIASQSEWRYDRTLGNPVNQLLIGVDQVGDAADTYDLNTLYATQSGGYIDNDITYPAYWFFGFNANLTYTNTYVIYIDLDHVDASGATAPPERNYIVSTIPAHQPEYAIYVDKVDGVINAQNTRVFAWDGSNWGYGQRLSDIGGFVYTSTGYVELQLLNGAIGMNQTTGSASVMLFSVNSNTGVVEDSVPSDPKVPGSAVLSRFSAVSDRINLISPPNTVPGDPTATPSILPFFWDWPTGSFPSTPFAGSRLEVHLDPNYTNSIADFRINSNTNHFGENNTTLVCDLNDNIYYWRVRARYWSNGHGEAFGAWTGGWSFQRLGFTAQNLQISIPFATPRFSWDMTEGAQFYRLQVSTDHNFSSTVIDQVTRMTSYTPSGTLAPAHYYWRVQVNRLCGVENDWSEVKEFDLTLLKPAGLTPDNPDIPVSYAPTFCWNPPIDENGDPVWIVWKYHVQVSQYMDFNKIYDSIDTVNNCWTPTKGYADGTYYWHVAMVDGNGRMGSYSQSATFIKLYPRPDELYSPINGPFMETPTFSWSPVNGATLYRLEVSLIDTFSTLYDWTETVNTKYTPSKIYASGHMYYWRVAIIDRDGNQAITFNNAQFYIGGIEENRIYLPTVWR